MQVWIVLVSQVANIEDPKWLLKFILQLIHKGPQIRLLLYDIRYNVTCLWCGTPQLDAVRNLNTALKNRDKPPLDPILFHKDLERDIMQRLRIVSKGQLLDLVLTNVVDTWQGLKLDLNPLGNVRSIAINDNLFRTNVAPKVLQASMTLGDIKIEVEGYCLVRSAPLPIPSYLSSGQPTREKSALLDPRAKRAFDYGSTQVLVTKELNQLLAGQALSKKSTMEILGFIECPPIYLLSDPIQLRPLPTCVTAFDALLKGLESTKKVALVRYQPAGGMVEMAVITLFNLLGYTNHNFLMKHTVPFRQDFPLAQFPDITPQPQHAAYEELFNQLPDHEIWLETAINNNGNRLLSSIYDDLLEKALAP